MSTQCIIAIYREESNDVRFSRLNYDTGIDRAGVTLLRSYQTEDVVQRLVGLGDLSTLGVYLEAEEDDEHSFENPMAGVTVAYHRDRGEPIDRVSSRHAQDILGMVDAVDSSQLIYLFHGGMWYCYVGGCLVRLCTLVANHMRSPNVRNRVMEIVERFPSSCGIEADSVWSTEGHVTMQLQPLLGLFVQEGSGRASWPI